MSDKITSLFAVIKDSSRFDKVDYSKIDMDFNLIK
jgi:hypothetical protein